MHTQLQATQKRIDRILAIREDARDQTALAAEYRMLAAREEALLRAIGVNRIAVHH